MIRYGGVYTIIFRTADGTILALKLIMIYLCEGKLSRSLSARRAPYLKSKIAGRSTLTIKYSSSYESVHM